MGEDVGQSAESDSSKESTFYVVGFAFDTLGRVALIEKNRPAWQAGRLNGIGGHVEQDERERPVLAMRREFFEETGTHISFWGEPFVVMDFPGARIYFYRRLGLDPSVLDGLRSETDEEVRLVTVGDANKHLLIPNLTWLIPLAAYTADCYETVYVQAQMAEIVNVACPVTSPGLPPAADPTQADVGTEGER